MTRYIVSVEKVLNSRCPGDSNVRPKKSHWGTFIDRHPSEEIINHVLCCCDIPRFSSGKLLRWFKNGDLFLGFEKPNDPTQNGCSTSRAACNKKQYTWLAQHKR
jgi:hypothetical protein